MNPAWGHLIGVGIVVLMMVFIGIWIWAWLPRHGKVFDRLARIPLQDPELPACTTAGDEDATR